MFETRNEAERGYSAASQGRAARVGQQASSVTASLLPGAGSNTTTTPFTPPSISLPKGGGAIRGIGEKFATNPATGTGSMTVPIITSPGRNGFGPQLTLSYDSGAGNSPFGFGWSLDLPQITRKTDKGLPRYDDRIDSDVFILSGSEDLVPLDGPDDTASHPGYSIRRYRPRIEGLFARIERWMRDDGDIHWRSISKDNVLTIYGKDDTSRIRDPNPEHAGHIFTWLICETRDDRGNGILYMYQAEDGSNLALGQAHEANRGPAGDPRRRVNRYIKRIFYGNRTPLLTAGHRPAFLTDQQLGNAGWMFEVVFDYDEGHVFNEVIDGAQQTTVEASPAATQAWARRNDPFSSYRAGFEVRTYRLCQRVLMFHHIPDISDEEKGYDGLVRSTDFTYGYETAQDPAEASANPVYSFLLAVSQSGYARQGANLLKRSLPPLELEYTRPRVQSRVEVVDAESLENLPNGLGSGYQWIDLHGEGIPGLFSEQAGEWFYKRNVSPITPRASNGPGVAAAGEAVAAKFDPVEVVNVRPNLALGGGAQFMDLAGDGQLDLVVLDGPIPGLFEHAAGPHDDDAGWLPFRPFTAPLNRSTRDPNLRFVDLDGNGHADVLITEEEALVWHPSLAEVGFGAARRVPQALDEEAGPRLVFNDGEQSIYLADMSGDGLSDLARIRNGEVYYWPNLGYGRFGAKVTMDRAPAFDSADQFDQARIRLADIDGSGTTDIIYLHRDGVRLYFNQSGNGWSVGQELPVFPRIDNLVDVQAIDLLGNGTTCLVWSSPLPGDLGRQMRYVSLMGDQKPHLLVKTANNLGAETRVRYASSTKFYLQDRRAGKPWITRLPFPVHVVERVETYDHVSRNRFVTRYVYHHGYFDGEEREFHGFGMVEQTDTEQFAALTASGVPLPANEDAASHTPPVLIRTWFHTGVYLGRERVSQYFAGLQDGKDRGEYCREPAWLNDDAEAIKRLLPDTVLPANLTLDEEREACRSLKGMMLRQEIYALDGAGASADYPFGHPYTVAEHNFTVRLLQARGSHAHAIFLTHPHAVITYHYEREPQDPRVQHALALEVDAYGNVLKEAAIGYGRRASPLMEQWDRDRQEQTLVTYSENDVTGPIDAADAYRTPLPAETRTYELTGYGATGMAGRYQDSDFVEPDPAQPGRLRHIHDGDTEYHAAPGGGRQRRLIERVRTVYRKDDLTALSPAGNMESLALTGESYRLALTTGLLAQVFQRGGQPLLPANPGAMLESLGADGGGYVQIDGAWWIPSGRVFFVEDPNATVVQELSEAQDHFYLPRRFRDPFGQNTLVRYDGPAGGGQPRFDLMVTRTEDAVGNVVAAANDYRVLGPRAMTDPNRNRTEVVFDALGLVVGTAVMGRPAPAPAEGDSTAGFTADLTQAQVDAFFAAADPHAAAAALLRDVTTRVVNDLGRFYRTRWDHPNAPELWQPAYAATLSRETHAGDPLPAQGLKIQISFSYSDGFGREVQKKIQAEPGPTPQRNANGSIILGPAGRPVMTNTVTDPRWVGSGWTVFNNKGKPVRRYEPFFSDRHDFELGVTVGVSPILFYEPAGRVVATLHPNHTWEKVVFDPWQQTSYDVNDTVTANPALDADIQGFLVNADGTPRIPTASYLPTWHALRTDAANSAAFAAQYPLASVRANEMAAAIQAAAHANTPTVAHFDALGRPFLTIAANRFQRETPAGVLETIDEAFATRVELDIEGNQRAVRDPVVQGGDALGRVVMRYDYDMLSSRIHESSMEAGERWTVNDATGKPIRVWDSRGFARRMTYDTQRRQVGLFVTENGTERLAERTVYGEGQGDAANHRARVYQVYDAAGIVTSESYDFKGNLLASRRDLLPDYKASVDWGTNPAANGGTYRTTTRYDALNRPVEVTPPDNSIYRPAYNAANLLNSVDVNLQGAAAATAFVTNIDYDAKGQRQSIAYGNGSATTYAYDPLTFRLTLLRTTRPAGVNGLGALFASPTLVQELHYTYDPSGNIVRSEDAALRTVIHAGQNVLAACSYTYDALYRLVQAQGREHIGQTAFNFNPPPGVRRDFPFMGGRANPNDPEALRNFTEGYEYDPAGNFKTMRHSANGGSWTRTYVYQEGSLTEPGKQSNRLTRTVVGNGVNQTETYGYDPRGNMTVIGGLPLTWNFKDQLQRVDLGGGGTAYYVYDAGGQRVRKVLENQNGAPQEERLYLGGFEVYRKLGGNNAGLERQTLHVMDDKQRIALVETRNAVDDGTPPQVIRYQLGNHLGSASLELTVEAALISYEEYHPYGTSALQAVRADIEVAAKRYRHTGKERDEETGLYYQGARYYAPWLGRWTAADPIGLRGGMNLYEYCRNSPINLSDPNGMDPPNDAPPVRVTPLLTDVNLTGVSGNFQFHNLFSSDRSVSGSGIVGAGARASFILDVPRFSLRTTGFADVSGAAAVDTDLGRAGVRLRGGALLGDASGLNLVVTGQGSLRIPVPSQIGLGGLPGSLLSAVPRDEGDVRFSGALSYGSFALANFRGNASLAEGRFTGRLDATTIGDVGRLRLDAAGTVSPEGNIALESARLRANVDVPGLNVEVRGTGTGTAGGGLAFNATGNVRLLGLPSLQLQGTGSVSAAGAEFSGRFSGAGPLFTSYITGGFNLSTQSGISASAGVFGLTYTPGVSITDPAPASPGLSAVAGAPASPWTPSGLTLGASYFRYSQGLLTHVSGGFIPDLSDRIFTNPRFGITAGLHF